MRHIIVIGVLSSSLLAGLSVSGQRFSAAKETALDTSYLRVYAETRGFMLGRPVKPKPTPDGKAVLFLRSQPRLARLDLYEFDVATGKTRELLTTEKILHGAEEQLSAEEKARRERMRVSVGGFTDFQLSGDGRLVLLSFLDRPSDLEHNDLHGNSFRSQDRFLWTLTGEFPFFYFPTTSSCS